MTNIAHAMTKFAHPEESKGAASAPAKAEVSKLKRFIGVLIPLGLVALLAVFAACGDDDDDDTGDGEATSAPASATPGGDDRLAAPLFSCNEPHPGTAPDDSGFPVDVTDSAGNTVTIESLPQSIASLDAAHTEVLYAIGAGDQVGSVDNTSNCPAEAAAVETRVDAFNPSVEAIAALEPDLVILGFVYQNDLETSLRDAGLTVITLATPESIDGVYEHIETLGVATGHATEAEDLTDAMQERIEVVARPDEADPPSVYHELDNTYYSVGPGSFLHDIYELLGAENIAAETGSSFPQLSAEAIIEAAPDVIILADEGFGESPDTVKARAGWDAIPAVQNDRIYGIDPDVASRPGPRLAELAQLLAGYLYEDAAP